MKFKIVVISFVILIIQGCIPSIHPLWTQDKLVFDENLLGGWTESEADENTTWYFSGGFDKKKNLVEGYELIHKYQKSEAKFEIHLVKLGEHLFFDIFPDDLDYLRFEDKTLGVPIQFSGFGNSKADEPDIHLNMLYFEHMMPVHTFAKVEIENDEIKIYRFDQEWLDDLFKQRKVRIKHEETSDGQIILTAPTSDLQKFFEKYANDEKAYLDPIILHRNI